jgi:hypothetical protein
MPTASKGWADLAQQIERTREEALDAFDRFRATPAAMLLSPDGTMVLMQLISRKLAGKRTE